MGRTTRRRAAARRLLNSCGMDSNDSLLRLGWNLDLALRHARAGRHERAVAILGGEVAAGAREVPRRVARERLRELADRLGRIGAVRAMEAALVLAGGLGGMSEETGGLGLRLEHGQRARAWAYLADAGARAQAAGRRGRDPTLVFAGEWSQALASRGLRRQEEARRRAGVLLGKARYHGARRSVRVIEGFLASLAS